MYKLPYNKIEQAKDQIHKWINCANEKKSYRYKYYNVFIRTYGRYRWYKGDNRDSENPIKHIIQGE